MLPTTTLECLLRCREATPESKVPSPKTMVQGTTRTDAAHLANPIQGRAQWRREWLETTRRTTQRSLSVGGRRHPLGPKRKPRVWQKKSQRPSLCHSQTFDPFSPAARRGATRC